jgi:hypothetical protein
MKHTQLTLFIHHSKTHKIMNKTWKTILQVIGYVVAAILGAAGGTAI